MKLLGVVFGLAVLASLSLALAQTTNPAIAFGNGALAAMLQ